MGPQKEAERAIEWHQRSDQRKKNGTGYGFCATRHGTMPAVGVRACARVCVCQVKPHAGFEVSGDILVVFRISPNFYVCSFVFRVLNWARGRRKELQRQSATATPLNSKKFVFQNIQCLLPHVERRVSCDTFPSNRTLCLMEHAVHTQTHL